MHAGFISLINYYMHAGWQHTILLVDNNHNNVARFIYNSNCWCCVIIYCAVLLVKFCTCKGCIKVKEDNILWLVYLTTCSKYVCGHTIYLFLSTKKRYVRIGCALNVEFACKGCIIARKRSTTTLLISLYCR